uniref:Uncharacterized protein n=1 Tax=Syphacia muris TaxID=451379 RepID=A0A0N5ARX3_9BILA
MCCGSLLKTALLIAVGVAFISTLISLFTPQWRQYETDDDKKEFHIGLLNTLKSLNFNLTNWENEFKAKEDYEKAVMVLLVVALIAELLTIALMFIGCLACCCSFLNKPIPFLVLGSTLCLAIAVTVYSINNGESLDILFSNSTATLERLKSSFGYSYWLAVLATAIMGVCTIVSVVAYCLC